MSRALFDFAQDVASAVAIVVFTAGMFVAAIAVTPCEYEDSTNCRWNAAEQGNGHGTSFLNVAGWMVRV